MLRFRLSFLCAALLATAALRAGVITLTTDRPPGRATRHGLVKLAEALAEKGWTMELASERKPGGDLQIIAEVAGSAGSDGLRSTVPESFSSRRLEAFAPPGRLILSGADDRGLMYALLELGERVRRAKPGEDPFQWQDQQSPAIRTRALSVYTMNRAHWESRFHDERYWTRYFDLLAASRFNRFLIVFGYENGGFLAPPYPYFFDTPGFADVKMIGLTREQQEKNLAALNRLIELAHDRGIEVSLGLWDHIYRGAVQAGGAEWLKDYVGKPVPNSVTGVTSENLNAYTLASLKELLARVPAIDGLQFRVHEESGLRHEEMDAFWREVFAHVRKEKPALQLEARGKGTPDSVIATALAQGVRLRIETKFWMEQMGLPFHPTHINARDQQNRRHGYADFLRHPQRYEMDWRLWNGGTTRLLLWGDPDYVRRFSEAAQLYRSPNWDVQEPLATKMEAQPPDMPTFALMPEKYRHYDYEFERYWHFFQVWGRVGYNPNIAPDAWRPEFEKRFGAAGPHVEAGLHRASQVLPMIVAAVYPYSHFPTTRGWPERQSLTYSLQDYANNEGSDTEQFESFAEAAKRILAGGTTAKRTPDATSRWFDAAADAILASVREAEAGVGEQRGREFDATITDLKILAQLARFHARRTIAAVHYNLFKRGQRLAELLAATYAERDAVAAWRELVAAAGDRYHFDLAFGARDRNLCGHWRDELRSLETDLRELEEQCCPPDEKIAKEKVWKPSVAGDGRAPELEPAEGVRVSRARPGAPLRVAVRAQDADGVQTLRLRYRHLTQFEDYLNADMTAVESQPGVYAATIPGEFITREWDLVYFVEAIDRAGNGAIWPDLAKEAPYVIVKVER